jgi:hypothetical protein
MVPEIWSSDILPMRRVLGSIWIEQSDRNLEIFWRKKMTKPKIYFSNVVVAMITIFCVEKSCRLHFEEGVAAFVRMAFVLKNSSPSIVLNNFVNIC